MSCPKKNNCRKSGAQSDYLQRIDELRENWKPLSVRVLFLAESPPEQTEEISRFFYNPQWRSNRLALRDFLRQRLVEGGFHEFADCEGERFLQVFQKRGFYLIDAISCPIEKNAKKKKLASECQQILSETIGRLRPQVILALGKWAAMFFIPEIKMTEYHGKVVTPSGLSRKLPPETSEVIFSMWPSDRNKPRVEDIALPFKKLKEELRNH